MTFEEIQKQIDQIKIPYIFKDEELFVPGKWNGRVYTIENIKNAWEFLKENPTFDDGGSRTALYLDHEDEKRGAQVYVGEVANIRFDENVGMIGDLVITDENTAKKILFQKLSGKKAFGISPAHEGEGNNIKIVNFSIVIHPAQGEKTMLSIDELMNFREKEEEMMEEKIDKIQEVLSQLSEKMEKMEKNYPYPAYGYPAYGYPEPKYPYGYPKIVIEDVDEAKNIIDQIRKIVDEIKEVTKENLSEVIEKIKTIAGIFSRYKLQAEEEEKKEEKKESDNSENKSEEKEGQNENKEEQQTEESKEEKIELSKLNPKERIEMIRNLIRKGETISLSYEDFSQLDARERLQIKLANLIQKK